MGLAAGVLQVISELDVGKSNGGIKSLCIYKEKSYLVQQTHFPNVMSALLPALVIFVKK